MPPQGPYGGQPYGQPGFTPPPPPPPSGSGPLIPLLIVGAVVVLVLVVVGAFAVIGSNNEKKKRRVVLPPPIRTSAPAPESALKTTLYSTTGGTFTRVGDVRTGSCTSRADADLLPLVRTNTCVKDMESALYTNSSRTTVVVLSVLKFSDSTSAISVNGGTRNGANPEILLPPSGSGLPTLTRKPTLWNRSWTRGTYVVYGQGYNSNGTDPGGQTGMAFRCAGDLGVQVANTVSWSN